MFEPPTLAWQILDTARLVARTLRCNLLVEEA